MEKPLSVANWLIKLAISHGKPPTQMKLQKLIFFAHGWNLAIYDSPLVSEGFQAWTYGPVIPSVYHEFKAFGTLGIDRLGTEAVCKGSGIEWVPPSISDRTGTVVALLSKVWEVFGKYTGTQLSEMTHAPDTPWTIMRNQHGNVRDIAIPDDLIQRYFKGLMPHDQ